jgi:hypothetical protein
VWAHVGTGKQDIYITCRELGSALKASLHESGRWHVGFLRLFVESNLEVDDPKRNDPYISKWQRPPENHPGITLAYRIFVPTSALNIPILKPLADSIFHIPAAPKGKAIEIAMFILSPTAKCTSWPGKRGMGAELIGKLRLDNGEAVWLVYHTVDVPQLPTKSGKLSSFKCRRDADSMDGVLRGLVFGCEDDGSRWIMECAVSDDFASRIATKGK